ncbi:hypothetical protein PISMIDRAFT_684593, partial [Pisolithus microcarpus 441]
SVVLYNCKIFLAVMISCPISEMTSRYPTVLDNTDSVVLIQIRRLCHSVNFFDFHDR